MENYVPNLWDRALSALKKEVDGDSFETWLRPTRFSTLAEGKLTVSVPNMVSKNWLASHYLERIHEVLAELADHPVEVAFEIQENGNGAALEPSLDAHEGRGKETYRSARLNDRYTFDTFVVGESNRFAHAAARAVADSKTIAYNPLFIYGGVGLGKTHLMQAIGRETLRTAPNSHVLYVTSEQFMNAFIDAVTRRKGHQFRHFYRNVDLLLIDDVQFFMGKESTQTEFFHTFNALYDSGRKIVVSSDRPPKELNRVEERLRSRFEWGLIVDIQPPDLETRMAILRSKAELFGMDLPYDIAIYIAERIKTNIRKLEGVLRQIEARRALTDRRISRDDVREYLTPFLVGEEPKKISPESISRAVCEYFDVEFEELVGKSRLRKHTLPRHFAMYLCRKVAVLSYPEIGHFFGNRDHTSVMHACRKIEGRIDKEVNVQNLITYLTKKVQESAA